MNLVAGLHLADWRRPGMVIDRGCRRPARTRLPRPSATAPSARPAPGASTAGPAAAGRRDGQVQPHLRPVHRRLRHPRRGRAGWRGWFAQGLPGEGLGFCATVRSVQVGGRRGDNEHDFGVTPVADDPLFALPGPPAHPCYETFGSNRRVYAIGRKISIRPASHTRRCDFRQYPTCPLWSSARGLPGRRSVWRVDDLASDPMGRRSRGMERAALGHTRGPARGSLQRVASGESAGALSAGERVASRARSTPLPRA